MKKKNKKTKSNNWKYIKKCAPYFFKAKGALIFLVIFSLIGALVNSFLPALTAKVLALVTEFKIEEAIKLGFVVLIISVFTNAMSDFGFRNAFTIIENTVINSLRKNILDAYYKIDNKILNSTPSGVFITRITEDPGIIINAFNSIRINIQTILSNLFVIFYIFYLNWIIGIVLVIGTAVVYLIEKRGTIFWNEFIKRRNKYREKNTSMITESVRGIHDIKLLNIIDFFKDRINSNIDEMYQDIRKSYNIDNKYNFIRNTAIDLFTVAIII